MPKSIIVLLISIPVLIVITLVSATATGTGLGHPQSGMYQIGDFTEPNTCGMCHPLQFEQWQGTMHNRSTDDPFYMRIVKIAEEDIPGISEFCHNCHAPVAVLTGQDPMNPESLDPAAKQGLSCDFCHTVSGMEHTGNFGYTSDPGTLKRGPFGAEPPIFHTTELSELHDSAEFCGNCHNVNHPLNGLALETTYTEFLDGPYSKEGYKCQTCHMTPGLVEFEAFPAASATGAIEREHIWTHWFVGANVWIPEMLGHDEPARIARDRLARAAEIEIEPYEINGGELRFEINVTNVGAGHMLPTGVTEERQVWLEVELYDENGELLEHWGATDEHGKIAEDTLILGTVFGDANGDPTHKIWFAESVLEDRRIAPRETDSQGYSFPFSTSEVGRIVARLWYRSSHQDFVDVLFADAEERVIVPLILMDEAEYTP